MHMFIDVLSKEATNIFVGDVFYSCLQWMIGLVPSNVNSVLLYHNALLVATVAMIPTVMRDDRRYFLYC